MAVPSEEHIEGWSSPESMVSNVLFMTCHASMRCEWHDMKEVSNTSLRLICWFLSIGSLTIGYHHQLDTTPCPAHELSPVCELLPHMPCIMLNMPVWSCNSWTSSYVCLSRWDIHNTSNHSPRSIHTPQSCTNRCTWVVHCNAFKRAVSFFFLQGGGGVAKVAKSHAWWYQSYERPAGNVSWKKTAWSHYY